jgi:hypothetical protein
MSFLDLISELRSGTPDIKKAAKAMKILGWICLGGAVWNLMFIFIFPNEEGGFDLPPEFAYMVVIILAIIGFMFFRSFHGIKEMEPWGKKIGQLAVGLLIGSMFGFMFYGLSRFEHTPPIIVFIFMAIAMAQFAVPAYFGIRYLGRLPVRDGSYASYQRLPAQSSTIVAESAGIERPKEQVKYKDSPSRFGVYGTLILIIAVPLLIAFLAVNYFGEEILLFIFLPMFLLVFFGPIIYNYFPSPFQEQRNLVTSFTGGGSIFLFGGSWPFFRLLVYEDAVEIRTMLQRYLIPYDKMEDLPERIGFFSRGILFKSDLPDVPSRIRYQGFGMKKVLKVLSETRNKYLETRTQTL